MSKFANRIRIGEFRHRIQIVSPKGSAQDSTGGLSLANTSPVVTTWARIQTMDTKFAGKEGLVDQEFVSAVSHQITIRYRGNRQNQQVNIQAKDQIYFGNRVFQVLFVANPDERTKLLILWCVEINDSTQQTTTQPAGLF